MISFFSLIVHISIIYRIASKIAITPVAIFRVLSIVLLYTIRKDFVHCSHDCHIQTLKLPNVNACEVAQALRAHMYGCAPASMCVSVWRQWHLMGKYPDPEWFVRVSDVLRYIRFATISCANLIADKIRFTSHGKRWNCRHISVIDDYYLSLQFCFRVFFFFGVSSSLYSFWQYHQHSNLLYSLQNIQKPIHVG